MAELKDSGARRDFGTGAVRDVAEGKGRTDLLPLKVISHMFCDDVLLHIETYIRDGKTMYLEFAIMVFSSKHYGECATAMLEVSKHYEDGCQKYGDRNWEKGIPLHCYIDSGVRHYLKFLRGDTDEPHDRAFIWNMLGAIWTHENKPELIDLPFADKDKPGTVKPVTGKYEGLSNVELQDRLCDMFSPDGLGTCDKCPLFKNEIGQYVLNCDDYVKNYPTEARAKMLNYLNGLEGEG